MADKSGIEWTEATWNPTTGCDRVSPGCDNCYAMKLAKRLKAMGSAKYQRDGDPRTSGPGFGLSVHPDAVYIPLRWREPRRIFVNSMSDLFHDEVPDEFIARVFAVMAATPWHTYQILTKRHARMRALLRDVAFERAAVYWMDLLMADAEPYAEPEWPLPNVWLGVSVESQKWADIRVPALLETPAAVRWLSCEPLLGPVDVSRHLVGRPSWGGPYPEPTSPTGILVQDLGPPARIAWVVAGGESGPRARPSHPDWYRTLRDRCAAAGVPYFHKQWGEWAPVGPLYEQPDDDGEADDARMDAVTLEVHDGVRVAQLERSGYVAEGHQPGDPRTWLMARVGKKAAGRELDGRTHDEYPEVSGG